MAELVDALVSNTNGAIRAGSIPALGTQKIANSQIFRLLAIFHLPIFPTFSPHVQKKLTAMKIFPTAVSKYVDIELYCELNKS